MIEHDHRHRRLGRDPADAPDDEPIEHHVADDANAAGAEFVDQCVRPRGSELWKQRHAHEGRPPSRFAANGSVMITSSSIRNSESPKLYSVRPAASMAAIAPSAAAARLLWRDRLSSFSRLAPAVTTNQIQAASASNPRSAAICIGTLCRCGLVGFTASGTRYDG